jgi:hypothetical protein
MKRKDSYPTILLVTFNYESIGTCPPSVLEDNVLNEVSQGCRGKEKGDKNKKRR